MLTLAALYQADDKRRSMDEERSKAPSQEEQTRDQGLATSHTGTPNRGAAVIPMRDFPKHYTIPGITGTYMDLHASSPATVRSMVVVPESRRKGPRGGVSEPFPSKLFEMLQAVDSNPSWEEVVGWKEHGRSFEIKQPDNFVNKLMSTFFKQTKYSSFQRQLHLYGFLKITSGPDNGCYYHPLFLRGRIENCKYMVRVKTKGHVGGVLMSTNCDTTRCISSLYDLPYCSISTVLSGAKTVPLAVPSASPSAPPSAPFPPAVRSAALPPPAVPSAALPPASVPSSSRSAAHSFLPPPPTIGPKEDVSLTDNGTEDSSDEDISPTPFDDNVADQIMATMDMGSDDDNILMEGLLDFLDQSTISPEETTEDETTTPYKFYPYSQQMNYGSFPPR